VKELSKLEKVALSIGLLDTLLSPEAYGLGDQDPAKDASDFLTVVAEVKEQIRQLSEPIGESFRLSLMTTLIRAEIVVNSSIDEVAFRDLSPKEARDVYRKGFGQAAQVIDADFAWYQARLFALAALDPGHLKQTGDATAAEWWRPPAADKPEQYPYGPLAGIKTELGKSLGGDGGRNDRTLEQKGRSGALWIERRGRYEFHVWFRNQREFAAAKRELLALRLIFDDSKS
jgi:hypothetical protein